MTILTLVRHGETDWNQARRIQGSTDIPLNETGRAQARDAAADLRATLDPVRPVVVVSSDLSRARETAQIIADGLDVPLSAAYPQLRERTYGEAEGLDVDEFHRRWGDWHAAEVPGAETRAHLRSRAVRGLRLAVHESRRETAPAAASLVIVSHGALIRELIAHASRDELPLVGERLANGSTHTFFLERERLRLIEYVGIGVGV